MQNQPGAGWLGMDATGKSTTPYLHEKAVLATASRLASGLHERSLRIFDYVCKRLALGDALEASDRGAVNRVKEMGEPIRWGTDAPLTLLQSAGFRHVRTLNFAEACLSLTGSYEPARMFRFQGMALASRSTWP